MRLTRSGIATGVLGVLLAGMPAAAQDAGTRPATRPAERQGLFGGGGPGMFGGGVRQERKLLAQFDKDKNGWLNNEERKAAREFVKNSGGPRRGPGGFGRRGNQEPPKPGPKVTPEEVRSYDKDAPLYEPSVLRTLFLEFENADWEAEVADFKGSDVEVPATLTVDGKRYPNVGVHFRGASSYGAAGPGYKKSINLTMDLVDSKQKLYGYKTLNLLNSNGDPTMLRAAVYSHIASKHLPVAKVNLVKVVINGEYWGVYANSQQVNKEFFKEHKEKFGGSSKGIRWKVPGSPQGKGSLSYLGDSPEPYKAIYAIKTEDKEEQERGWKALIHLCKMLKETPPEQVEEKISPLLNIEGALWFLAIENALINSDGYWIRNSDYHLFLDEKGKFHVIPHDINEALAPGGGGPGGGMRRGPAPGPQGGGPGGPPGADGPRRGPGPEGEPRRDVLRPEGEGRGDGPRPEGEARPLPPPDGFRERGQGGPQGGPPVGGPRGGGVGLDPMTGAQDASKPLLNKLLASPKLKEKYLRNIRTIAAEDLDWEKLGPVVQRYVELIEKDVEADTRKLDTFEAFKQGVSEEAPAAGAPGRRMSLKQFAEQRRKFLLEHPAIKALPE